MKQCLPHAAHLTSGGRDCLWAGDTCSSDDTCSPRLRTLRQCVAGDGSVKLGPGARNQCEAAMTALLSTPLHGCQCKRGMKKEKNCLSIYWSLHQSVLHGLNLVENFPYEAEERGSDYVRLASIAAGKTTPPTLAPPTLAPPTLDPPILAPPKLAPPKLAPLELAPPTRAAPMLAPPTLAPPTLAPP
ncbi:unnamed protein product [Boreogadus saida]